MSMPSACLNAALLCVCGTLVLMTSPVGAAEESFRPTPGIRVNTIGYLPQHVKRASVAGAAATGEVRPRLPNERQGRPHGSARRAEAARRLRRGAAHGRLLGVPEPGEYVLRVEGLPDSPPFRIAPDVFNASLRLAHGRLLRPALRSGGEPRAQGQPLRARCLPPEGRLPRLLRPGEGRRRSGTARVAGTTRATTASTW